MKKLPIIIYSLLLAAMLGLLGYQIFVQQDHEFSSLMKPALVIAGALIGLAKAISGSRKSVANKKAAYRKAYSEYIGTAFSQEPKLEKMFYNAVDDYNQGKPSAGIAKLEKLRKQCQRSDDYYAVIVFTALCYDDMKLYSKALEQYYAALQLRRSSTIASNMGLCHERMGNAEQAMDAYIQAVQIDPKNNYAYNNLAQQCIRRGDYAQGLGFAEKAVQINERMPQALNAMAICHYMLGDQGEYERYYRMAVSSGSDGNALKRYIASLDPEV